MENPNAQNLPVNTRTRANILWNLQRDLTQTVGGGDWTPFQEKAGVFGMRKRIPVMPGIYFEIGVIARSTWQKFDLTTRQEYYRNLGTGVFLDESLLYQAYFAMGGQGVSRLERVPRVMKTSQSHLAVLRVLEQFMERLRRAL